MEEMEMHCDEVEQVEAKGFTINDTQKAEWAVRKVAEHRAKQQKAKELYEKEVFRLKAWLQKETDKEENRIEHLQGMLYQWYITQNEKSISLPSGRVRIRKLPDKFNFTDETAVIAWAKVHQPKSIRVKEEIDKNEIKRYIKETGEIPDGVEVEKPEPVFEVKPE